MEAVFTVVRLCSFFMLNERTYVSTVAEVLPLAYLPLEE